MSKASPIKTSFNGGIQSPLLQGHIDAPSRHNSVKDSTNLIPLKQGPVTRRGGTKHANRQRNTIPSGTRTHLIPFYYNDTDSYILEITGDERYGTIMRTYKDDALVYADNDRTVTDVVVSGGTVVITVSATLGGGYSVPGAIIKFNGLTAATELNYGEYKLKAQLTPTTFSITDYDGEDIPVISSSGSGLSATVSRPLNVVLPYNYDDLFDSDNLFKINYEQSNDVLYLAHPDYPTYTLTRTSSSPLEWSVTKLNYINGPWDENSTDVEIGMTTTNTWPDGRDFTLGAWEAGSTTATAAGSPTDREYIFSRNDCSFNEHLTGIASVVAGSTTQIVVEHTSTSIIIDPLADGDEITLNGIFSLDYATSPWDVLNLRTFKVANLAATSATTSTIDLTDPVTGANIDTTGYDAADASLGSATVQTTREDRQFQIYFERNRDWPENKTRWRWGRLKSIPASSPTSGGMYADITWTTDEGNKRPYWEGANGLGPNSWLSVRRNSHGEVTQTGPGGGGENSNSLGVDDRRNATLWSFGAYSERTGYPSVVTIHEGRLVIGGSAAAPRRLDLSASGEFSPTEAKFFPFDNGGVIKDNAAIQVTIGGGDGSPVLWVESTSKGLLIATTQRTGILASGDGTPITPTNVSYRVQSAVGSADIKPVPVGESVLFVQSARRKLHGMGYNFQSDGYSAPDLTILAEHLTRTGIVDMAWQQEPINTLWLVLTDGSLIALTYDTSSEVTGWHRHVIGGDNVSVESVACAPSTDGSRDQLWLAVSRDINNSPPLVSPATQVESAKFVEYMERWYEDDIVQEEAYHVDGGVYYDNPLVVPNAYSVSSGQLIVNHTNTLSDGDVVLFENWVYSDLNGQQFKVDNRTVSTFNITYLDGSAVTFDTDLPITVYSGTGGYRKCDNTFNGLQHLAGQTAQVYADGKWLNDVTIPDRIQGATAGQVTLGTNEYGARVSIGLPTTWHMETHRIEAGGDLGTAQGKSKRIDEAAIRVYNTLGMSVGDSASNLRDVVEGYGANAGVKTPLYTGDHIIKPWPGTYDRDGYMYLKGEGPFPAQIQAIMPQLKTSE